MNEFLIHKPGNTTILLIEPEAYEGVRRIGARVAQDIELVTGERPELAEEASQICTDQVIVGATAGKSRLLDCWKEAGKLDISMLEEKREVYQICIVDQPFPQYPSVRKALVIAGSDKRGTIYGLFHLSEMCGVSPLIYWGDVKPEEKRKITLEIGKGIYSKEPSVKYRGFFINDEWPAFGKWCSERFGGINAKAYEEVFIFLLRMKGNYLWPAMWNSSFSEDGPGLKSAELADMYGVIMGLSHHEPMCRAGVEWQRIYRQYGEDNTWNFAVNSKAITEFWRNGILRNRPFEQVITIGMRGESDSALLPENAGLSENIQVIKDAVLAQHKLLREHLNPDLTKVPRMLAIYKEVEEFYYGDETCAGLKDWDELDDVIFMLCDDNFGNVRGLPEKEDKIHPGGYGMYYHFDYHGAPVSYEWQNSSRLTKTWEQMTRAYTCGVKELWIVNVGDIKGVEYPLTYFMALAYDYETWSQPGMVEIFVRKWIEQQFSGADSSQREELFHLIEGWTKWSAARRPEAMNPQVYHPWHYREGSRVWEDVNELTRLARKLKKTLPKSCQDAYLSMVYYPASAVLNLILMHVEAGLNAHYAERRSLRANRYGEKVKERVLLDSGYVDVYHRILGGKWNHMMDSAHTGFRTWCDNDWVYPAVQQVIPIPGTKITAGFQGSKEYHLGLFWQDGSPVYNEDFTRPDTETIWIDLDSRGSSGFRFNIYSNQPWLQFTPAEGRVEALKEGGISIAVTCDRTQVKGREEAEIEIAVQFDHGGSTVGRLVLAAGMEKEKMAYPEGTFVEHSGYIAMDANHYAWKHDAAEGGFQVVRYLGRMGDAVKAFPADECWIGREDVPCLYYDFAAENEGMYTAQLYLAPRNPGRPGGKIRCQISVNDGPRQIVDTVSDTLHAEWDCAEWSHGVLKNIRKIEVPVSVRKGLNRFCFGAGDPEIVLERIILYPAETPVLDSYLGPPESWRVQADR